MFRSSGVGARQGVISLNGTDILTPNYIVPTRRGVVAHLTPDNQPVLPLAAVYAEDFYEARTPLLAAINRDTLPIRAQLLVGAVRAPDSLRGGKPNTNDSLCINTHQGFQSVGLKSLVSTLRELSPDVLIVPHDSPDQSPGQAPGCNRLRKMRQRSLAWIQAFIAGKPTHKQQLVLATVSPELVDQEYVDAVNADCAGVCLVPSAAHIAGAVPAVPREFTGLRVCGAPYDPATMLKLVLEGGDLFYAPVDAYSDAGHALDFDLAATTPALYANLGDARFAGSLEPVGDTGFTKGYIHHLLEAREMIAQVVLQQHNLAVFSKFFSDVRAALAHNTLENLVPQFLDRYRSGQAT